MELQNPFKFYCDDISKQSLSASDLDWIQAENHKLARESRLAALETTGLLIGEFPNGELDTQWLVSEDGGNPGYLFIGSTDNSGRIQEFIDSEGYRVACEEQHRPRESVVPPLTTLTQLPDDGTWFTLVVRRALSHYEPGTVSLTNASTTVTGTGTQFTRYGSLDDEMASGYRFIISVLDDAGAAGQYSIASITSDTSLELNVAATDTQAGLPFQMIGVFDGVQPTDKRNHYFLAPEFELVTRTRDAAAGDIILADVMRTGGVVTVIDRRNESRQWARRVKGDTRLIPDLYFTAGTGQPGLDFRDVATAITAGEVDGCGVAPCADGGAIAVYTEAGAVKSRTMGASNGVWGGPVTVVAAGEQPCIVRVPLGNGSFEHACFYVDAQVLYMKTSNDLGATWSASSPVWDPTTVNPAYLVRNPFAYFRKNGLLVVVAEYDDGTTDLRNVNSDDYGATWDTNGDVGYGFSLGTLRLDPSVSVDTVTGKELLVYSHSGDLQVRDIVWSGLNAGGVDNLTIAATAGTSQTPACWTCHNGQVHVIYNEESAGDLSLWYVRIANDGTNTYELDRRKIFTYVTGTASTLGHCSVAQLDTGAVCLVWVDSDSLGTDKVQSLIFTPACHP